MKVILMVAVASLLTSIAQAKETCKVQTNDIGTIVGTGSSPDQAFEDAATKCYDRRAQLYRSSHGGRSVAEDDGLAIIDICANVRCS